MSLNRNDWAKILGGIALIGTGAGFAGLGPLGTLLGAKAGAAVPAGAAATKAGFGSLIAPSLVTSGLGTTLSGAQGTPKTTSSQFGPLPQMDSSDPFDIFRMIQNMKKGGFS